MYQDVQKKEYLPKTTWERKQTFSTFWLIGWRIPLKRAFFEKLVHILANRYSACYIWEKNNKITLTFCFNQFLTIKRNIKYNINMYLYCYMYFSFLFTCASLKDFPKARKLKHATFHRQFQWTIKKKSKHLCTEAIVLKTVLEIKTNMILGWKDIILMFISPFLQCAYLD